MNTLKYCCEDFKIRHKMPKFNNPNIRIIKNLGIPHLGLKPLYSCEVTSGYVGTYTFNNTIMIIYYCPFCGQRLRDWYTKDEYANEIQGQTF